MDAVLTQLTIAFRTGVPKTEYEFKIDFFKEIITEVLVLMCIARHALTFYFHP